MRWEPVCPPPLYTPCAKWGYVYVSVGCLRAKTGVLSAGWHGMMQGYTWPTHPDERKGAGRIDRDAPGLPEQGAGAVAEACRAAAGESGGLPVDEVDPADPVAAILLRCITGGTR